ncbi:MAG TPA: STAS domain-containing protein [Kineosporiaceae bacterium]|nr:STAS domain-containing protein [Kineosporiaceae bacterium]
MAVRTTPSSGQLGDGPPPGDAEEPGGQPQRQPAHLLPFSVSAVVVDSTAVLSIVGRVRLGALPACRHAVDNLLRDGVEQITVDLQVAHFDDESIALLALMRRYTARHGVRLTLAEIPPQVARVLERAGVSWLYRTSAESSGTVPLDDPRGSERRHSERDTPDRRAPRPPTPPQI